MENTATEYPGITSFREWYLSVYQGMRNVKHTYQTADKDEIRALLDSATLLPKWFGQKGIKASFGASKDVYKYGFTFKAADCSFIVLPSGSKPAKKKNVAITSIMAYKQLDDSKVALKIARAAIELTIKHGEVSDSLVAKEAGEGPNRVSARRKDTFENPEGITIDGKIYRVKWTSTGKCLVTGFTVHKWAMVPNEAEQMIMRF